MILSGEAIKARCLQVDSETKCHKIATLWKTGRWTEIQRDSRDLLIYPFDPSPDHLKPASYDLSLGDRYGAMWDLAKARRISNTEPLELRPTAAAVVVTKEFLGLPPSLGAVVLPRPLLAAEGCLVSPQHVDPTWHGKLLLTVTNHGDKTFYLAPGHRLCTCVFYRIDGEVKPFTCEGEETSLGRRTFILPQGPPLRFDNRRKQSDEVGEEDLRKLREEYGHPWDVVAGLWDALGSKLRSELKAWVLRETTARARDVYEQEKRGLKRWLLVKLMLPFVLMVAAGIAVKLLLLGR